MSLKSPELDGYDLPETPASEAEELISLISDAGSSKAYGIPSDILKQEIFLLQQIPDQDHVCRRLKARLALITKNPGRINALAEALWMVQPATKEGKRWVLASVVEIVRKTNNKQMKGQIGRAIAIGEALASRLVLDPEVGEQARKVHHHAFQLMTGETEKPKLDARILRARGL